MTAPRAHLLADVACGARLARALPAAPAPRNDLDPCVWVTAKTKFGQLSLRVYSAEPDVLQHGTVPRCRSTPY